MRKGVIIGLGIAAAAVIGYVGFNAWIAFVPPKPPVSTWAGFTPECEAEYQRTLDFSRGMYCQALIGEGLRLKEHPGLALREGDALALFYRGEQTARLAPPPTRVADGPDCDSYLVHKVLAVHDPAWGRRAEVAQISCHRGEFEQRFIAMPDGSRWIVGDASSSPGGGKIVAVGQNRPDFEDTLSRLTIVTWPDRKIVARFRPRCRVLEWQAENHFTVTCIDDMVPFKDAHASLLDGRQHWLVAFDAKVSRDRHGRWRMQATRWLSPRWAYNDAGDLEYPPTFSLLPLPRFTAETPSQMAF